jgi:ATP adenylyltransferase
MVDQLWAPWRLQYVTGDKPDGCVLCAKPQQEDDSESLVVFRGQTACVILNLYPYNPGHLMVVPTRHVADLTDLTDDECDECMQLMRDGMTVLRQTMSPGGFNLGLNQGDAGGAGIADHLHWHVVPRWEGDTNFMPVIGETKVMPQHMQTTWQTVSEGFAELAKGRS